MKISSLFTIVLLLSLSQMVVRAEEVASSPEIEPSSEKSAQEIARELANPNNSLASLTFRNQYRLYDGSVSGASEQENYTLLFQPVFPFGLDDTSSGGKANLFVRPAFPLLVDQPVIDPETGKWEEVTGMADIGFDIGYGVTEPNGLLWATGLVGTLPTATDSRIGGGQLRLGPELLLAKFYEKGVVGIFPSHQWDVAGWQDGSFSTSQCQIFANLLPGDGWAIGTIPIMNYNWESSEWSIPLNLTIGKTVISGKTPVRLQAEINYYIERPDSFGSDWMIGFNVTPVVENFVEQWIRGK